MSGASYLYSWGKKKSSLGEKNESCSNGSKKSQKVRNPQKSSKTANRGGDKLKIGNVIVGENRGPLVGRKKEWDWGGAPEKRGGGDAGRN